MSLFDEQNAAESDYLDGPGFTGNDMHPSTFEGLTPMTPLKGAYSGVAEGLGTVAKAAPGALQSAERFVAGVPDSGPDEPWKATADEMADTFAQTAKAQAKSMMPDPEVTGSGTNLIFGFAHAASQAIAATAVTKDPLEAAPLFGYLRGMGHYRDLKDQGVDEDTAERAGKLEGLLSGASFLAPAGLPAKWLGEMTPALKAVTQLTTGASVNTGVGMVSRYMTADALTKAGYPELAEQNKVGDGQAILADMLSGAFFGGMHFWSGHTQTMADTATKLAEDGVLDPAIRDAAKVAQDQREMSIDRAPGVPVDAQAVSAHHQALEKALSDLGQDKPVDFEDMHILDGATFARQPQDEIIDAHSRAIIHQEFMDAGVLSESSKVDQLDAALEGKYTERPVKPYTGDVMVPKDDGTPQSAEEATAKAKEDAANDETPQLLKAASDCVGRI
jgi:hypothetical protein